LYVAATAELAKSFPHLVEEDLAVSRKHEETRRASLDIPSDLAEGTWGIFAVYGGSTTMGSSTSATLSQVVN
jgi:hypothetical protein